MEMVHHSNAAQKHRDYASHPICDKKASECGGYMKAKCCIFGDNGPKQDSRPSEKALKEAKKEAKKLKQRERDSERSKAK